MTSLGHIYMIWTPLDNSFCYIGSTFNRLHKRFEGHKYHYKHRYGSISIHKYFNKFEIDNFKIELIKSYNVIRTHQKDHKHLHAYETLWINKTKNCVNKQAPFNPLTNILKKEYHKQYNENHKEEIVEYQKEYHKQYRENNKEELVEYQKEYREKNKKEISEQKKEHYGKNKQEILEKAKQHYQKNKKELNEKRQQKFNCECGSTLRLSDKARHFKSKKHIQFLEKN